MSKFTQFVKKFVRFFGYGEEPIIGQRYKLINDPDQEMIYQVTALAGFVVLMKVWSRFEPFNVKITGRQLKEFRRYFEKI